MKSDIKTKIKKKPRGVMGLLLIILVGVLFMQTIILVNLLTNQKSNQIILNTLETSDVDLVYHTEAVECVKADRKGDKIIFLADIGEAKDVELFSISFNVDKESSIGIVKGKNGQSVQLGLELNAFDETMGVSTLEIGRLINTQENLLDNIMSNLLFEEGPYEIADKSKVSLEDKCMKIHTPFVQLYYPKDWEEYLVVKQNESNANEIEFYCSLSGKEPIEIFTVVFDGGAELPVGHLNGIEVGLSIKDTEAEESWTDEEKEIFYTMKEDSGIVIDGLMQTEGFVLSR